MAVWRGGEENRMRRQFYKIDAVALARDVTDVLKKMAYPLLWLIWRSAMLTAVALSLAGCWHSTYEWNQKVTVVVQTPEGENSGSAVSHLFIKEGPFFASGSGVYVELQGEATVVEVLPGKYLFALLGENASKELAGRAWPYVDQKFARIEKKRESIVLPPALYPMLATFNNFDDPQSIRLIDPDDLDATFGLCENGKGLRGDDAPWRSKSLLWNDWARDEWNLALARRSVAEAGFSANIAPLVVEYAILDSIRDQTTEEWRREKTLFEQLTASPEIHDQFRRWNEIRHKMQKYKYVSRDTSKDCYRVKSISLEISDDPVTQGEVEKHLKWLGPYPDFRFSSPKR